jgi:glycosyltransferase involved in cell wall biosynthesis
MGSMNNLSKFPDADPIISIITVVYNAKDQLEQTILSVINQSYKSIQFIIIDGGSTDGTLDVIKKYQNNLSYWGSEPDNGVYDAMNKGVKIAKGDWLYFLGAGDILFNIVHKLVPNFKAPNTIYYGDVYKLDELKVYNGHFSGFKLAVSNICHQAIFYPATVFERFNYNLKYRTHADHDLNMRLYGDSSFRFKYLNIIISIYEGDGLSTNSDLPFFADKLDIVRANFPLVVYLYTYLRKKLSRILNPDYKKSGRE